MNDPRVVTPPDCSPHVRDYLLRVTELFTAGDLDVMVSELITPDVVFHDHRPFGPDPIIGPEATRLWLAEAIAMIPDWRITVEVLAQDGDVYLARDTYFGEGTDGGFGPAENSWYVVDTLRDGKLAREEIYEHEEQARAAYERLLAAQ